VANHASIRDEQELSLIALDDHEDLAVADVPGTDKQALPVMSIFGANASGKSNVIDALAYMRSVVIDSHQRWLPGDPIDRRPFLLDAESRERPSTYIVDFALGGTRFEYGFSLSETAVDEEWLYAWPEQRRRQLFERGGSEIKYGPSFPSRREHPVERPRSTGLLISAGASAEHPVLFAIYTWFRYGLYPALNHTFDERLSLTMSEFSRPQSRAVLALIKYADLGINNLELTSPSKYMAQVAAVVEKTIGLLRDMSDEDEQAHFEAELGSVILSSLARNAEGLNTMDPASPANLSRRLSLIHHGRGGMAFDLASESSGTRTWLGLIGPMVTALRTGTVLIVDELDAHLHPHLAARLIGLFQSPRVNRKGAQLVFNTHDVTLMSKSTPHRLHRDQIYFAEKDLDEGNTRLYPLTEFARVRDNLDNLERWYLSSRLGAVPVFFDSLLDEFADALSE
jgi:hypothetical protein